MVGTLITSAIALLIGVPVAVATALYLTELCPRRARAPLGMLVDLLAAVPSVVYGLWGVFVLGPKLEPVEKWFANTFSFIPFIGGGGGTITPGNYFIAGLILAIMILPDRLGDRPRGAGHGAGREQGGGARAGRHALGDDPDDGPALRAAGITGGAMLGLGRAIGETIAVVLTIGNAPTIGITSSPRATPWRR